MKKIAIVTINSQNYGNRLQNFALQFILENLGYDITTLKRQNYDWSFKFKLKNYLHYIWKTNNTTQFFKFNKLIKWSKGIYSNNFKYLNNKFDYFIAGSDQVWNPVYSFTGTELDFLTFAESNKRIAYAASFGVSKIPTEKVNEYKNKLEGFEKISVREDAGATIIQKLNGKQVPVVLDPTMLLTANQWRKIEKKPSNMPSGKYTLVYSVESMSDELKRIVNEERKKNLVIDVKKMLGKEFAVGPAEFLYLIDHADKILTDSFHGTVFSILFHTPFVICNRDGINMNSRIETLLNTCELSEEITEDSFANADKILELKRKESIQFLKNALE